MSSYKDRAQEMKAARKAEKKTEYHLKMVAREKQDLEGQGEYLGIAAGEFGAWVGSRFMQTVIALIQTAMLLGFGAAAIAGLYGALF